MAVGVYAPKKQSSDSLNKLLTIGGAAVGGAFGGPAGAMTGASMGQMAGGLLSSNKPQGAQPVDSGPSDALSRRMQKLGENPQRQIAESIDSLKYVQDDGLRAELARPLLEAQYMAKQRV